ncbi:MAG: pimeloyl-ACP methyl ester carboxylesterase, partial [Kiritimatiellia bacterium]
DGLYPGDVEPSDTWPFHRPGQRGLLNAVCSRWYDASGVVKMEHKPPLLWLRGEQDPVISDAGEEDLAVVAAAGGDRGWPGPELCPPQPMIAQMAYFLDAYSQAGGQTASHVLPGAHLPWLSHPDAFARIWHTWIMGSGR